MRSVEISTKHLDNKEYILCKNVREELEVIPYQYITSIVYKLDEVGSMTLEIPKFIERGGEQIPYPLYDMVKGKRHIVVKENGKAIARYVIDGNENVIEKKKGVKTVTAYTYENILKNKTCLMNEGLTRQLYRTKDETVHVADGVLNIFEEQTGWKVAYIDDFSRKEEVEENVSITMKLNDSQTFDKVEDNLVLFDEDVNVPSEEDFALNFDISWLDLEVETTTGSKFEAGSMIHTFVDLPTGVKHIKATFTSTSEQRYGITYDLTLTDGTEYQRVYAFVNCRNMKLVTKGMNLTYFTSEVETKMATKYRYLEHTSTYWYQYLKTTIQDAFDCYIFFNSYDKTISVYDREKHGEWKGFHLDFDNWLTKINKTPKIEDICTRLWIESTNVDITEVNPLGTSYLEDYSYFVESGTMSSELKSALERYYARLDILQADWKTLKEQKDVTDQWLVKRNSELVSLNAQVKAKNSLLTAYIKDGKNPTRQEEIAKELAALEEQVSTKTSAIAQLKEQSDELLAKMQLIGKQMDKQYCEDSQGKIFTDLDLEELTDFTIEQTYKDDYHTRANTLFEYSKDLMKDYARLKYDFTLEHKDLAKGIKHPLGWSWFIELGGKIEVDDKDITDSDGYVTVYSFTYSPKNNELSNVEFTNTSRVIEAVKGLANIGKLVHNTAGMTDYWKHTWVEAENATVIVSDIRKNGLDLASNIVRGGGITNKISMSEAGLFVIDANNEDNQIYIGASLIAITTDRWITSKTAISEGGVIADTIVGRLLLGEQLFISNEDGSFSILPEGLSIKNKYQEEIIGLGINKEASYFHLGTKDDSAYLIFDEKGRLDIKATSLNLTVGDLIDKEEIEDIINGQLGELGGRNYALDTVNEITIVGDGNSEQVVSLYSLSVDSSYFFEKTMSLGFDWEAKGEIEGEFYIRTSSPHAQSISKNIKPVAISVKSREENTVTITEGDKFTKLELVAKNLNGSLTIGRLKFERGKICSDWTPAPEDSNGAYSIILSNEAQLIPTDSNLLPLKTETYKTQVMLLRGSSTVTNFKIKDITNADGFKVSIQDDIVSFAVNKTTPLKNTNGSFNIVVEVDGKTFTKVWSWSVVQQGADGIIGESAKLVVVTGEQVFKYNNGLSKDPENKSITLTASLFNTKGCQWYYRTSESTPILLPGATSEKFIVQHDGSYWEGRTQLVFRCVTEDEIYDEITISKIANGQEGVGSYTIFLTNETHVIPCDYDGKVDTTQNITTNVVVYKGTEKVSPGVGEITCPSGMAITKGNPIDKEIPIVFTIQKGYDLADSGSVEIPVIVEDKTFTKMFGWSKSKDGQNGTDAQYVVVTGEQIFKYNGNNSEPTPSTITLKAEKNNIATQGKWQWQNENQWVDIENAIGETLVVTPTTGGLAKSSHCLFRYLVGNLYDSISIAKLYDGSEGISIVEIREEYYLSISQQALIDGAWQDKAPTWEKGKFIWTRTTFVYSDGSTKETTPICVTGADGVDGTDGGVSVSRVDVFYYQSDSPTELIGGEWVTQAPIWVSGKYIWSKTITYLNNGKMNETPPVCLTGEKGEDGISYTVILTNENHTFPCEANGEIIKAITTSTNIKAYKQTEEVTPIIGNLPSVEGLTLSKQGSTITIQANVGNELADTGSFSIPITVEGTSLTKIFSWTKSKKGASGESAKTIDIVASTQVFKSVDLGKTYTPNTITLSPILQNVELSKWQYSLNSTTWTDVQSGSQGLTIVGDNLIVANTSSLFTTNQPSVTFKAVSNVEGVVDTCTILKIVDTSSTIEQIQGQIQDIEKEIGKLEESLSEILEDGVITEVELKVIESHLTQLDKEKTEVMAIYEELYANKYLNSSTSATIKTQLKQSKDTYDTKHQSLKTIINTIVSDGVYDVAVEKPQLEQAFSQYNTALAEFKKMVQKAVDFISDAKKDEVYEESKVYTNAQIKVLSDSITQRVERVEEKQTTVDGKVSALETWKSSAEQKITADAIINTVSSTITQAKNEAISEANSNTANSLKNYSTTTQMNSAIEQKADSITSTVSSNYTDLNGKIQSANTAITQATNQISSKVDVNGVISSINQTSESIKIQASKIQLGGATTIGSDNKHIRIEEANYSVFNGSTTCLRFGYKNWNGWDGTPELLMGYSGFSYTSGATSNQNGSYFGMSAWGRSNNPESTSNSYHEMYYRCGKSASQSQIKMYEDGVIKIDAVKTLELFANKQNYVVIDSTNGLTFPKGVNEFGVIDGTVWLKNYYFGIKMGKYSSAEDFYFCKATDRNADLGHSNYRWRNIYATNGSINTSDINLKENIIPITDRDKEKDEMSIETKGLTSDDFYQFVKELPLYSYDYKSETPNRALHNVGFIAQDIAGTAVGDEFVFKGEDGIYQYNMQGYVGVLAVALQNAIKEIENLKEEVRQLKTTF